MREGGPDCDQIAQGGLGQHFRQHALGLGATGQGENGQDEEGRGDRHAIARQDQQEERRDGMPPLNAGFRIGQGIEAPEGDVLPAHEPAPEHDNRFQPAGYY